MADKQKAFFTSGKFKAAYADTYGWEAIWKTWNTINWPIDVASLSVKMFSNGNNLVVHKFIGEKPYYHKYDLYDNKRSRFSVGSPI